METSAGGILETNSPRRCRYEPGKQYDPSIQLVPWYPPWEFRSTQLVGNVSRRGVMCEQFCIPELPFPALTVDLR